MTPPLSVRLGARALDAAALTALGLASGYPLDYGVVWLVAFAVFALGWFVGGAAYGRTPGKAALGLRIAAVDGGAVGLAAAARREAFVLLGAVPFVGPLLALAAWIALAVGVRGDPEGRGFHDRWAGTRVVRG